MARFPPKSVSPRCPRGWAKAPKKPRDGRNGVLFSPSPATIDPASMSNGLGLHGESGGEVKRRCHDKSLNAHCFGPTIDMFCVEIAEGVVTRVQDRCGIKIATAQTVPFGRLAVSIDLACALAPEGPALLMNFPKTSSRGHCYPLHHERTPGPPASV
jgi:hypothetical protein